MSKPTVFISHLHVDGNIVAVLEDAIRRTLLGGVQIFNTSNRVSVKPGDPWREEIIRTLRGCDAALVIATPESVTAPWVNFESGGAWLADKRVIPCCARGMKKSSLPAPLRDLQALELGDPKDLRDLLRILAEVAGLDSPANVSYEDLAARLAASWSTSTEVDKDEEFAAWINMTMLRPVKHKGEARHGELTLKDPHPVDQFESGQFYGESIRAGDSLRVWVKLTQFGTIYYCFVNDGDADIVAGSNLPQVFEGDLKCIGTIKTYDTDLPLGDEDRGISYHPAYVAKGLKQIKRDTT